MNVDSIGVWTLQWADALPGAILLLLGAVTLWASAAHGWGVSSSDSHPSPLPRLSPVLISLGEPAARVRSGHSASTLSRAPPGPADVVPPRRCHSPAVAAAVDDPTTG